MIWNAAKEERLRELWQDGLSMSLIALDLDPSGKTTRSAVAGRIKRLAITRDVREPVERLPSTPGPSRKGWRQRKQIVLARTAKPARDVLKPDKYVVKRHLRRVKDLAADGTPVDILSISGLGCRWPVEMRDGSHLLCNRLKHRERSYCPRHMEASYQRHLARAGARGELNPS